MLLEFIGETLEVIGAILIALTVIMVHETVVQEHSIDARVNKSVRKEHVFVFLGVAFIIIGYILQQLGKYAS